ISSIGYDNLKIINCNISNYAGNAIFLESGTGFNISYNNVSNSNGNHITCGWDAVNCNVNHNNVYCNANSTDISKNFGIIFSHQTGSIVEYNNIYDCQRAIYYQDHSTNSNINNNYIKNGKFRAITITENSSNSIIDSNYIDGTDTGIHIHNVFNVTVSNNVIHNVTLNTDHYLTGIYIRRNSTNIILQNNTIDEYGRWGIMVQQSSFVEIYNTTCNQKNIYELNSSITFTWYDPSACIFVAEIQIGHTSDVNEDPCEDNRTNFIHDYYSYNITIRNVTYNSNVQTILRLQGTENITHDLDPSTYWYRKFQAPTSFIDASEFYNNNEFDELSTVVMVKWELTPPYPPTATAIVNNFYVTYNSAGWSDKIAWLKFNYTMSKTMMSFTHVNRTWGSEPCFPDHSNYELKLFNLSLAYPYNDIYNQTGGKLIASNVDTYTSIIPPNHEIRVGDYTPPSINFVFPTPDDNNETMNNHVVINISSSDGNEHYTFLDWNRSLVGWWRFEENASDESGYGNDGTTTGVSYTTGKFGKAFVFDVDG
ncbi:hypothetical protein LCGC14_2392180, partial [marine sediment metagenome]